MNTARRLNGAASDDDGKKRHPDRPIVNGLHRRSPPQYKGFNGAASDDDGKSTQGRKP